MVLVALGVVDSMPLGIILARLNNAHHHAAVYFQQVAVY